MGNRDTAAIYEVDWEHKNVTFFNAGEWEAYVRIHQVYSYEEIERIFAQKIYRANYNPPSRFTLDGRTDVLSCHAGERILSREFEGIIPDTGAYEWFSDFLVMGDAGKLLGNIRSIHKQKIRELENEYCARHDQLTGLYNRKTFEERFAESLKTGGYGCLGILDIDNFKKLNDEHGHIQGDQALEAVSRLIQESLPEGSLCGRYGGDEFLMFFPAVKKRGEIKEAMEHLTERMTSLSINGSAITISIGFAFSPEWGTDFVSLLGHADMALRFSKKTGKNRYSFCTEAIERIIKADDGEPVSRRQRRAAGRLSDRRAPGRDILIALGISVVVLIGALLTGVFYRKSFRRVMMNESYVYLHEISSQMSGDVIAMLENNWLKMEAIAAMMQKEQYADSDALQEWLSEMADIQGFYGSSLLQPGDPRFPDDFVHDVLEDRQARMLPAPQTDGHEGMLIGYPIQIRTGDGNEYLGMVAMLDEEKIWKHLTLSVFEGTGLTHIITPDGRPVLRSGQEEATFIGDNLYPILEQAQLYDQETVDHIRQQIADGDSFQIHFSFDGDEKIAALVPVGMEGWYLMTVLSTSFVYEKSSAFSRLTMVACLVIGMIFLVLLLAALMVREYGRRRLRKAAYVDPVTGGNNQARFIMQASYCMAVSGYKNAFIYANVTGFKTYNDRMGRTEADGILKKIYEEIESSLGNAECMGRLMADHFGILLKAESLGEVTGRIEDWNLQLMRIGSQEKEPFSLRLNYGIYFVEEPGVDVQQMLDRANLARQSVAQSRRNKVSYAVYDKAMKDHLLYERELTDRMESALEQGEFCMFLQPKYGLKEGTVVGMEALARWNHPVRGMIMPGDFIPLFEKNGFIERLDLYMFREACKWIQQVIDSGRSPIPVSVNMSVEHFYNPRFLEELQAIWQEYGFVPSLLELEFTESMMYGKMEEFHDMIRRVHEAGFRCSMDDFGSGYSSLNELGCLPFDVIKLDRQFFLGTALSEQKRTTVQYVIKLIKALRMEVVAEGIESMEQVEWLREYGCDVVQGYVYGRPVRADEMKVE